MKNLIAIIIVYGVWALPGKVNAQINEERMDKDLRVASRVLETLTQGDERLIMYNDNVEGNYIEGYGVIFSINGAYGVFRAPTVGYSIRGRTGGAVVIAPEAPESPEKKDKELQEKQKEKQADFENLMIEFLVDYSQMIGQLKATDKIVVSTKKSDYLYVAYGDNEEIREAGSNGITAEMLKKDHNDYMAEKINRAQFIAKIKINRSNGEALRSKDLDLFSSMMKTVYDEEYTDSYFISWRPDYERIKGIGAIYSFKVYSSYDEEGLFRMPGINEKGLTGQQRNENVERLYPIFVESMKEDILQYGRTINSLENNEMILLKITLTKCDGCSIPKKIQFAVKQSVLSDFNTGKTSLKEASTKVKVSEL